MAFDPDGVTYGPGVVQLDGVVEYAGDPAPRVIAARVREVSLAADSSSSSIGPPPYHADAVHLDGDFSASNHSALTLPATASTILIAGFVGNAEPAHLSGWQFQDGVDQGFSVIAESNDDGTTYFELILIDVDNNTIADMYVSVPVDIRSGWHSFAFSADTTTQTGQLYVDRQLYAFEDDGDWELTTPIAFGGAAPDAGSWTHSCIGDGSSDKAVEISNFIVAASNTFFDLSNSTNLNKLFSTDNKPTDWGTDGSAVTGSQPIFFFAGPAAFWLDNLGTAGGVFTTDTGTITNASTSPSD